MKNNNKQLKEIWTEKELRSDAALNVKYFERVKKHFTSTVSVIRKNEKRKNKK
jgi:hypothetical protein